MSGKCRPSLRAKTLENVKRCNLSQTDKDCIVTAFALLESAINGQETLQEYIAKQDKEIERLKAVNKLENTVHETLDVLDEHLKFETQAIKAEAYKEFAERLKMLGRFTDGDRYYIDNLLKEMTENN